MDLQPTLENKLVRIRPLDRSDLEPLYQVAKDPKIWEQHPRKRHVKAEFEKFFYESMESNGALSVIDQTTDSIIGSSRYKTFDGVPNMVEIGWTFLGRAFWGGTYNKAMKTLMIQHAFDFVDNIISYVDKDNIRSQKAVQKIGGQKVAGSRLEQFPKPNSNNLTFVIKNENARS